MGKTKFVPEPINGTNLMVSHQKFEINDRVSAITATKPGIKAIRKSFLSVNSS